MTVDMLERRRIDGRDQALVLVTDGENDRGIDPKKVIPYLRERDVNLYVVGMAGDEKAPVFIDGQPFITVENKQLYTSLDDTSLRELTELGRGRYYRAKDEDALRSILKEIGSLNRTPLDVREIRTRRSDAWMAALAAFLLFLIRQIYLIHFVRRPPL
jgi:Ca-activated chloride channel family protein